jgi:hypothetical protein
MRTIIFSLFFLLQLSLRTGATGFFQAGTYPPDTALPDPSGHPAGLSGPSSACTGMTSYYFADLPVGCRCQWLIDGIVQADTLSPLAITWTQTGLHEVGLSVICNDGQGPGSEAMTVSVPETPVVFLGNDTTILQGQILTLDAGNPGSHYLWSTGDTSRLISVNQTGTYSVQVLNDCGADSDTISVFVFVSIAEPETPVSCFSAEVRERKIRAVNLPEGTTNIRIYGMDGKCAAEGVPGQILNVSGPGLYVVSVTYKTNICKTKIMVR